MTYRRELEYTDRATEVWRKVFKFGKDKLYVIASFKDLKGIPYPGDKRFSAIVTIEMESKFGSILATSSFNSAERAIEFLNKYKRTYKSYKFKEAKIEVKRPERKQNAKRRSCSHRKKVAQATV